MPQFLLVDNGSLRPDAFLNLKRIAEIVGSNTGEAVHAAPLLHSHKIDPAKINGQRAVTLPAMVKRLLKAGESEFVVVPLFFGPSGAITDYLPKRIAELASTWPKGFRLNVLGPLVEDSESSLEAVGSILFDHFREGLKVTGPRPAVVLVDHGSPKPEVCEVRDRLGRWLEKQIATDIGAFSVASMERREGDEYAFTDPKLEAVLRKPAFLNKALMILPLFLSPGRHAGPRGDISGIVEQCLGKDWELPIHFAPLVGEHPGLCAILAQKIKTWRNHVYWHWPETDNP